MKKLKNIHPGEILLEEFLNPMGISQNQLARDMQVPPRRINEIVLEKRNITADTDLRLSRALGTSEGFWLGLQIDFDLEEQKNKITSELAEITSLMNSKIESGHKKSFKIAESTVLYRTAKKRKRST